MSSVAPEIGDYLPDQASGLVLFCPLLTGLEHPFSGPHLQNNGVGMGALGGCLSSTFGLYESSDCSHLVRSSRNHCRWPGSTRVLLTLKPNRLP